MAAAEIARSRSMINDTDLPRARIFFDSIPTIQVIVRETRE